MLQSVRQLKTHSINHLSVISPGAEFGVETKHCWYFLLRFLWSHSEGVYSFSLRSPVQHLGSLVASSLALESFSSLECVVVCGEGGGSVMQTELWPFSSIISLCTLNVKIQSVLQHKWKIAPSYVSLKKKSLDFRKVATLHYPIQTPGMQNLCSAILCMVISELTRNSTN